VTSLLEAEDLVVSYGAIQALQAVSVRVGQGEAVAILGANGAGKTTLLRAIAGLARPVKGGIRFDGRDLTRMRPAARAKLGIAMVPEGRQVFSRLTVFDNLRLGSYARNLRRFGVDDARPVFELFPRLEERRDQLAGTLSGGEQQMLAIGRALTARPRLLMLDEPSMGLSPILVRVIVDAMQEIKSDVTILLVEQNVRAALDVASRGYLLESGQITASGASADLTEESIQAAYLGR
jgi:branched-chain amino acid transport system ATP-binding protein